ncbi:S8 family serine peptidase [Pontibacter roseus]|uniref:S8 family serine peptidase n=1 Tax=Pontibacter roseus TaxID=336989 RepID=UPI002481929F|nr:S8 family serine peptidase [Pontibacter roseus]
MLIHCITSFLILLLTVPAFSAQGQPTSNASGATTKPHTVIYKLKAPQSSQLRLAHGNQALLQSALQQVGATAVQQKFPDKTPAPNARKSGVDLSLIYEMTYKPGQSFVEVQRSLLATGMVAYVEPLYQRVPLYQPNDPASDSTKTTQGYLKLIQAYGAWAEEKGDTNIVIGVLDTGFRLTHEDIKNQIKYNYDDPVDGIDNDGDGLIDNFQGWDFADKDNNPDDDSPYKGHGVGVAGLAGGDSDNGIGIASVGFNSKMLLLKVFPSTQTGGFGGYEAIVHAADKGCSIINLSWGGEGSSQYEQDIINYAVLEKDAVIVAAGGNTNANVDIYPAAYYNVLSVGGINRDVKTSGQTWSYKIDISAPSSNVRTTTMNNDAAYGGGYGTSYASPMVAGAAALVRSKHPYLNAQQVMERLRSTADDIYHLPGNEPYLEMLGKGRLNVKRAIKETHVKAVRCTSFTLADGRVAQVGDTMLVYISLTNYLDPTSDLQLKLTSNSPYVRILEDDFAVGSMATLASTGNASKPFKFVVSADAPLNELVAFRLGFEDGDFKDFQYFNLHVNPDHITLNANNLHITLNSQGNIGYNAFNFNQGMGVRYKGSNSLIFEGGLLVATSPTRVSDNVRNASWQTDKDFDIVKSTRMHYNTALADQEIKGVMRDKYPNSDQAGVQVRYRGMAWANEADADYVILEYTVENITEDTLASVYTGLFSDWNIGDAYTNVADWDEESRLGYVYNLSYTLPYAGIKLLNHTDPAYYAIDNLAGGSSTFSIADGFSAQEKHRALSGGVARKRAKGAGSGNDVSHVVGTSHQKLAPGATRIVAFAVVAGDDLEDLKKHAEAAQQRYQRMKSGPAPLAYQDTLCAGTALTLNPTGGSRFNFYADEARVSLLSSGANLEIPLLSQSTVVYVSNADSLFESPLVPMRLTVPVAPQAKFSIAQTAEQLLAGNVIRFRNESMHGRNWIWDFGNGETSTVKDPDYIYSLPGTYDVKLTVEDMYGCSTDSMIQKVTVLEVKEPEVVAQQPLKLYPNPTRGELRVALPQPNLLPELRMTDIVGKVVYPPLRSSNDKEAVYNLAGMAEGVYLTQVTYKDTTLTLRVIVMRQ